MSVGQASGLALVAAARAGVPVAQYSPNEVKLAVTGDGRADKAAVQMMVARLLGLRGGPEAGRRGRRARARVLSPVARAAGHDRERGDPVIGSVRGTVIERPTSGEVLVEVGGVGYRVHVPLRAVPTLDPGAHRVPVHAPARARRRDGAVRVPDARRTRHVRGAHRRDRRRAEARARDPVGAHARPRCGAASPTTTSTRSCSCPASASAPRSGCWSS